MSKKEFIKPRKRNINQEEVSKFLSSIGFTSEKIIQEWRHVTAFGKYEGKDAVFKLASTIKTSRYTQNEFHWNEAVHLIDENERPNFTVPLNFSSGKFGDLYYFIAQRFLTDPFALPKSVISDEVVNRLQQVAQATREIELLPISGNSVFGQKHHSQNKLSVGQKLLQSAAEWASEVPRDLDAFLKIIDESKDHLKTCPIHGDFVIRQMYDVNGKIGAIDGEHAAAHGAYHYDVAQFYLRLRNDYNAAELAQEYLTHFYQLLPKSEQETFWLELKPSLVQRYIGDLIGAAKDPNKLKMLEGLGKEILEDKIFTAMFV